MICALAACSARTPERRGWWVVASDEVGGSLSIIDGQTGRVARSVAVGKRPRGVQPAPNGRSVWVALSGSPIGGPNVDESKLPPPDKAADALARVEVPSGKIVQEVRGVSDPEQLAVSSSRLFVASEDNGTADIFDAATGRLIVRTMVGAEPEGVALSPDGKTLLVTSEADHQVALLDARSGQRLGEVSVGERPRGIAFSPDGRQAYVTCEVGGTLAVIDLVKRRLVRQAPMGREGWLPMGIVASPDGGTLYVTMGRGGVVAEVSAATLRPLRVVRVGKRPWGIGLSPDGSRLYVANGPSNDVSVLDTRLMTVAATVPVGERPWGIAIVPK